MSTPSTPLPATRTPTPWFIAAVAATALLFLLRLSEGAHPVTTRTTAAPSALRRAAVGPPPPARPLAARRLTTSTTTGPAALPLPSDIQPPAPNHDSTQPAPPTAVHAVAAALSALGGLLVAGRLRGRQHPPPVPTLGWVMMSVQDLRPRNGAEVRPKGRPADGLLTFYTEREADAEDAASRGERGADAKATPKGNQANGLLTYHHLGRVAATHVKLAPRHAVATEPTPSAVQPKPPADPAPVTNDSKDREPTPSAVKPKPPADPAPVTNDSKVKSAGAAAIAKESTAVLPPQSVTTVDIKEVSDAKLPPKSANGVTAKEASNAEVASPSAHAAASEKVSDEELPPQNINAAASVNVPDEELPPKTANAAASEKASDEELPPRLRRKTALAELWQFLDEGWKRDQAAREALNKQLSTEIVLVREQAEPLRELAVRAQSSAAVALQPLVAAVEEVLKNPKVRELEDIVPLPIITWLSQRTKGYAGDISPKRATRILRHRTDAILLDIRDLQYPHGGAHGVPDLRLGARGKAVKAPRPTPQLGVSSADAPQVHLVGATEDIMVAIPESGEGVWPAGMVPTLSGAASSSPALPYFTPSSLAVDLMFEEEMHAAALARQSEVIARMRQVVEGKLVIVLDQDGVDSPTMARLLKQQGIEKPYVVRGGFENWVETGLRTKDKDNAPSSTFEFVAEELEALFEDTENIVEMVQELSRSDVGKVGIVVVGGATVWCIVYNVKLAFELFVCVLVLDQIGSSWEREPVSLWEKLHRIQNRFGQFAQVSRQAERLRSELAGVLGKVKEREREARKAHAKGEDIAELKAEPVRMELLKEELASLSAQEGSLLHDLRDFLNSPRGKFQSVMTVGAGSVIMTHSDELFEGAVVLLFLKLVLDRVTTRAEKKRNPLFERFEEMIREERDKRAKKLLAPAPKKG